MNRAASSPVTRDPAFPIGSPLWHTIKHGAPGGGGRWVVGAGGKDEEEEEEEEGGTRRGKKGREPGEGAPR